MSQNLLKFNVLFFLFIVTIFGISFIPPSFSHLEHLPHYNGGGEELPKYYVNQALEPEAAKPGEPTEIIFSIQDRDGNDVYDIETMVEIYESITGERVGLFPWTSQHIGDFEIPYTFEKRGSYQIVISVADDNSVNTEPTPARSTLLSTADCSCERAVLNITITENFGDIWNAVMIAGVILPLTVFGFAIGISYLNKKKKGLQPSLQEVIKYLILILALAGGMIHLGVYAEHGGLRLEYSIFLLSGAVVQIAFGILYMFVTVFEPANIQTKKSARSLYRKILTTNLFGLVGTAILLGLYVYVVIYPPPLSPNNEPEEIEFSGLLAKSVEFALIIGIVYLMKYEKKKFKMMLIKDV